MNKLAINNSKGGRKLSGLVVSDKMKKTVVVRVDHMKKHSKYLKYFKVSQRLKAHDEKGEYKAGDHVIIQETRPISKDKRWIVLEKINQTSGPAMPTVAEVVNNEE